jgi:hypothetical protein
MIAIATVLPPIVGVVNSNQVGADDRLLRQRVACNTDDQRGIDHVDRPKWTSFLNPVSRVRILP